MKISTTKFLLFFAIFIKSNISLAFCGFFVGKAGAELFNENSQVVVARDGERTVLTMANDFKGDLKEFALVVPVPTVLKEKQIHVADPKNIAHLDAFTSPRLAEYHETDPCAQIAFMTKAMTLGSAGAESSAQDNSQRTRQLGVKIEAQYTVGEYDILILSAKQSDGLLIWLNENGYKTPDAALPILKSYIKQNLKFFVAKVNLKEKSKSGFEKLRPLQIAFESKKYMLPIRLGTVNANGNQDLIVYGISPRGRIEVANYHTQEIPANMDLPVQVKKNFEIFYRVMFIHQANNNNNKVVFLEYAWDLNWCDPCAADPLSQEQLKELGAMWLIGNGSSNPGGRFNNKLFPPQPPMGGAVNAYVTRLHLRYNKDTFPEDLSLYETSNRENFQARYVLRNKWKGNPSCDAAKTYLADLENREAKEMQTLAFLTGWKTSDIEKHLNTKISENIKPKPWYEELWK